MAKKDSISSSSKISLFAFLVAVLLVVSLVKTMVDSDPLTFGGLLDTLASAPSIDMSLASFEVIPTIVDWGSFQFLANFINFFITIWNVQIYLFKGLFSVASYLIYFIKFIFVG